MSSGRGADDMSSGRVQMTHHLAGVDDMSSGKGADDMSPIEKNLLLKQHIK